MFGIGAGELVLILIVALIVFGPERLPDLGKSVGKAMREFKAASESFQSELTGSTQDEKTQEIKEKGESASKE